MRDEKRGCGGHRLETGTQLVYHAHLANSSGVPISTSDELPLNLQQSSVEVNHLAKIGNNGH